MVDNSWDINKYIDETEHEQQWILRKSFMEKHKNNYPENRLVCLAKIFTNIEFLGCIYNSELMILVKNLAKQVDEIVQYWESKKNKIGRTFVRASEAVKKNVPTSDIVESKKTERKKRKQQFVPAETEEEPAKKCPKRPITDEKDWQLYLKVRNQTGYKGKFILYANNKSENDQQIKSGLSQSCTKANIVFKYQTINNETANNKKTHQLLFDQEVVAEITTEEGLSANMKTNLCKIALAEIKKYCFTLISTIDFEFVEKSKPNTQPEEKQEEPQLQKGIGAKIMKMMGWKGEGLGKNETGIKAPIEAIVMVNRKGFGNPQTDISTNKRAYHEFTANMNSYIAKYLNGPETKPLQFSKEFTKEERKFIHTLVTRMPQLKSQSYGKGANRAIRVFKKIDGWTLVKQLLENGGKTDQHLLIKPTDL